MDWQHRKRVAAMPPPTGQCPCTGCARHVGPCKTRLHNGNAEADHLIPRAHGGNDGPLRWMCRTCNRSRGATLGNRLRATTNKVFIRPRW